MEEQGVVVYSDYLGTWTRFGKDVVVYTNNKPGDRTVYTDHDFRTVTVNEKLYDATIMQSEHPSEPLYNWWAISFRKSKQEYVGDGSSCAHFHPKDLEDARRELARMPEITTWEELMGLYDFC